MTEKEHVEMRYDDKNKSNHDNQRAWDYVMYMMLTSYFDETNMYSSRLRRFLNSGSLLG